MAKKKTAEKKTADKPDESTFEESVDELQVIVGELESGALGLEESLSRFEQGTGLLRSCYKFLESAEQKIEILTRMSDDGEATTEPFDAETSVDKAATKRKSRAKAKPKPAAAKEVPKAAPPNADDNDDEVAADADARSLFD